VTVPRCFLKNTPNGVPYLFLWANSILLLLLLGFSNPALARDPLIAYSENGSSVNNYLYYSQYQSGNWTTGAQAVSDPSGDYDGRFRVVRTNPTGTKQVVIWKNGDPGGRRYVLGSIWDGTNWDDGTGSPYGDVKNFGRTVDNEYRSIDAAYEESSGDLLVVSGINTTNTLYYWTLSGTTWSSAQPGFISVGGSVYRWVKLAPKPGTDTIGFIGMGENLPSTDEETAVAVAIWDGSAWGNTSTPISYGGNNGTDAIDIQAVRSGT
jgi:hypothetical protein